MSKANDDFKLLINWRARFTDRQLKEVEFCRVYNRDFGHGTDGHNAKLIIAKMMTLLDVAQELATERD